MKLADWAVNTKEKHPSLKYPLFAFVLIVGAPLATIGFVLSELGHLGEALEDWVGFND